MPCWKKAAATGPLKPGQGKPATSTTKALVLRDTDHLYVGVTCDASGPATDKTRPAQPPDISKQEHVALLIDSNHDRKREGRHRTAEGFRVEPDQIGTRAAPAADQQDVELVEAVAEPIQRVEHRRLGRVALNPRAMGRDPEGEARLLQRVQHVVVGVGAQAGDEPDAQRQRRQGQCAVDVE